MQIIDSKNKSIKMRVGIASAALCASFLLGANNSQTAKADAIDSNGQELNSALNKESGNIANASQVHPDIPVQVVGGTDRGAETANANSLDNQNEQLGTTNTAKPTDIPVTVVGSNSETGKPTITKTGNDTETGSSKKIGLENRNIDANYDETTWDDIKSEYDANKHVLTLSIGSATPRSPKPVYQQFANIANDIQVIDISGSTNVYDSLEGFFSNLPSLTTINGLEGLNVANVTDMSYLFDGDTNLVRVDLSNWTTGKVTDMNHMFSNCTSLKKVYINNDSFNVDKVVSMQGMFQQDKSLNYLGEKESDNNTDPNYAGFDVRFLSDSIEDMSYMFQGCDSLVEMNFDVCNSTGGTHSAKTVSHLFADCTSLRTIWGSGMSSGQISDYSYMLANCPKLETAGFQGIDSYSEDNLNINASHMFYNDPLLKTCYFGNLYYLTDISYMFAGDKSINEDLTNIISNLVAHYDYDNSDGELIRTTNMSHMLDGCSGVTELDLSNFSTNDNLQADKTDMFKGLTSLKKVTLGKDVNLDGTGFMPPFEYTAVGTGSEDKPNGKTYTATGLRKFWNKQTGTETFIGTPATYYQVTINYLDAKTKKVLKSTTKVGNSKDPIEFAQEYQVALNELTKDGNYTYDSKNSNVPLDKNNDIQLPDTVNSDVTYNVMLVPKETPVIPAKPPVVPDNPSDNHDQDTDQQPVPGKSENTPGDTIITNVIVHYQDEFSNRLQADKTITGKLGGSWNAVPAEIKGYHLVATKGMATGAISDVRQEVTFVYTKDQAAKPNKPAKPSRPDKKPSQNPHKKQKAHKKQHAVVIDHGAVNKPVKKTKSNKVASFTRPTIVKVAHATSVGKSIRNNSSYDSKLPQTGTDDQTNTLVAAIGAGALLTSMISAFGISKKKKIN